MWETKEVGFLVVVFGGGARNNNDLFFLPEGSQRYIGWAAVKERRADHGRDGGTGTTGDGGGACEKVDVEEEESGLGFWITVMGVCIFGCQSSLFLARSLTH